MLEEYIDLFTWHYWKCELYRAICMAHGWHPAKVKTLEDLPYLPAQYFKHIGKQLVSTEITQWLKSSGTSGTQSVIGIDRETIKRQQRALAEVLVPIIGEERKPFVLITPTPLQIPAGLRGLLALSGGWKHVLIGTPQEPCVAVGFTSEIWRLPMRPGGFADGSVLLHTGGWKNAKGVSLAEFGERLLAYNLKSVDLYGFTEQLGTVYPTYDCGYKHCPPFARVIVRDPATHEPCQRGMGQFITTVPKSYPGFSVLTDDEIELFDCDCQPGQAFTVHGRYKGSEIRGCGGVY